MLTDIELDCLLKRNGVTAEGCAIVKQIRAVDPARRVGGGASNMACQYPSHKMGCYLQAESHTNELAALYLWDHDNITHEIYDQPPQVKLNYVDAKGHRRGHRPTPDFFIIQDDFVGWVECKPESELRRILMEGTNRFTLAPDGTWQSPGGSEFASQFGLGFAVRSSVENSETLVRNLKFLSDYWYEPSPIQTPARTLESFNPEIGNLAFCKLADLIRHCVTEPTDEIYRAIVRQDIYVNLQEDVLAEPEMVNVFRSESLAEAFSIRRQTSLSALPDDGLRVQQIAIEAGTRIIWDGVLFEISFVADDRIYFKGEKNQAPSLSPENFVNFMKAGAICGVECPEAAVSTEAEECVATASPRDLALALKRYKVLSGEDAATKKGPAPSARTIRYWKQLQRQGKEKFGDGLLGLVSSIAKRGPRERILSNDVIEVMKEVIRDHYLIQDHISITLCYGIVRNKCDDKGLIAPCEKTFRKEVKAACDEYRRIKIQAGAGVAYKKSPFIYTISKTSPRHGDRPFEIGHIDSTEIDLQLVGAKNRDNLGKAWLTVLLDAYSRAVLAFVILFDKPSYRSNMLVIRECIRRHGRICSTIVVDGGKEFQNGYFESLLAKLSCTKKTRPRKKPRFGSLIERYFGISNTAFFHNLRGNNKPLQNPREMSASHDPRRRAIWTLHELVEAFANHAYVNYGNNVHASIGISPNAALSEGLVRTGSRPIRMISMTQDVAILCLPTTKNGEAKIVPYRGIKINYLYYFHSLMRDPKLAGTPVPVRYDPYDVSQAFAFIEGRWVPCKSEYAEAFRNRTEKEIAIISRELNSLNKQRGERRKINAQSLAREIVANKSTEARLAQEKIDVEQRMSQPLAIALAEQCTVSGDLPAIPVHNKRRCWADVKTIPLGEMK